MRVSTDHLIGRWTAMEAVYVPHEMDRERRDYLIKIIREGARKYKIKEGDECFVCEEKKIEVLRKHHLVPVSAYCGRRDLNQHMVVLCQNCHDITHKLIHKERGGLCKETKRILRQEGLWTKYVELDRMAARALIGVPNKKEYLTLR